MSSPDHNLLKTLIEVLSENRVEFIVGGGVAVVLHGIERFTMDLDICVKMEQTNLNNFLMAVKKLGLIPRVPIPAEALLNPENVKRMVNEKGALVFTFIDIENPFRQIDLFLTENLSYPNLIRGSDQFLIGKFKVSVMSIAQLIAAKKSINPPRDKDLLDIKSLTERANKCPKKGK